GANFIAVRGPEVLSKWVGESEKMIREIFRKARQYAPAVVFFDEIDAIASVRGVEIGSRVGERIVSQLLTEIDGISELSDVVVIAATNRPDIIDPALLRPGRLEKLIYVPPPDVEGRLEILRIHTRNVPLAVDVDLMEIARRTEGYTGADLAALVREAAMLALRENLSAEYVAMRHLEEALLKVKPSVTEQMIEYYRRWLESARQMKVSQKTVSAPTLTY
ncbi:MAG: AAA family ATPase, partial [Desulfurococcales archaeon]|nr:AAA family ATPase [Desulfurococcales archaeon]